jgi:hypothetical protein
MLAPASDAAFETLLNVLVKMFPFFGGSSLFEAELSLVLSAVLSAGSAPPRWRFLHVFLFRLRRFLEVFTILPIL